MKQKKTNKKTPPPARAVREYTAGGVVYRRNGEDIEILMIQDPRGRWSIPKGHVEPGETLEQTAIREITEETGLKHLKIRDKLDKLHFFYRKEGKLIFMTNYVYLIEATRYTGELDPEEWIAGIKWFPAKEALEQIEYRETQKLFQLGLNKLKAEAA